AALPPTTRALAVLDRTKEPGSAGEPLLLDVLAALDADASSAHPRLANRPRVTGGRYGLSSKEFTPAMVKGVLEELSAPSPRSRITVGIRDDVGMTSVEADPSFSTESPETFRAVFYGLGSDGTVSANKNSIKIIGELTSFYAQGYFVYDSKKAGSMTVSHLRFGPRPIRSTYLIRSANFVACHQFGFLERMNVLELAQPGATFLLNSPYGPDEVWNRLPASIQREILDKKLRLFVIDAYRVAREAGLGRRINTIMQTCFFAISGILPKERAIEAIKASIEKTYGRAGDLVVQRNFAAVDAALAHLHEVDVSGRQVDGPPQRAPVPPEAPEFVRRVTAKIIAGKGDELPVSALPPDGTYPSGTSRWEKRAIALEVPVWDEKLCIQCGKCVLVCPHAVIRGKVYDASLLDGAPAGFKSAPARWRQFDGKRYTLQVSVDDCTGCRLCVEVCPVRDKSETRRRAINMEPVEPIRERERENWRFFDEIPAPERQSVAADKVKDVQLLEPLFEFSGACAGCGETPYLKLMTQLFGDRALVANATGCSSIYGGNLPTTPWSVDRSGRGPAWSNSLFEDNAEFGLGMRLAVDHQARYARELLRRLRGRIGERLVAELLEADQSTEAGIAAQRERVAELKRLLAGDHSPDARDLLAVADALVARSVWIVGGDGWAYDIGYGGLDHVLASGENVNILVLDTEVYSNTGGQMSKATPRAAVAKFAAAGKPTPKKDLARMAIAYGNVYVAQVAMGASDTQTLRAFLEAESYPGPSLIVAYCHCIAHGYDLAHGMDQQKAAVSCGYWPLFRYDPRREAEGKNPFQLDSKPPRMKLDEYALNETRYTILAKAKPEAARELLELARRDVQRRWAAYRRMAEASDAEELRRMQETTHD
ncbi:MAG: pyruvate:ferredoxin (flavodoxin) oxidoreductase, partial [Acidobacteria bacterium]